VWERFAGFGVDGEGYGEHLPLLALSISPQADLAGLKRLLRQGEAEGWWWYEEGCISDAWRSTE
jgi:hypothetical protein